MDMGSLKGVFKKARNSTKEFGNKIKTIYKQRITIRARLLKERIKNLKFFLETEKYKERPKIDIKDDKRSKLYKELKEIKKPLDLSIEGYSDREKCVMRLEGKEERLWELLDTKYHEPVSEELGKLIGRDVGFKREKTQEEGYKKPENDREANIEFWGIVPYAGTGAS